MIEGGLAFDEYDGDAMVEQGSEITYRCDCCGRARKGETIDAPPPGCVAVDVRPLGGVGFTKHACLGRCLAAIVTQVNAQHANVN